ncbi:hypothetical protein H6F89_25335 [Cyanobacteria bacterium FACHB-63]|nr:hypothetical protein [Cyanobacteria bacterium FACHB-63]
MANRIRVYPDEVRLRALTALFQGEPPEAGFAPLAPNSIPGRENATIDTFQTLSQEH